MKKKILLLLLFFSFLTANAAELKGGVSINDVPKTLFGTWKVYSVQYFTSNPYLIHLPSYDIWNIYRQNNVITLENPDSGAVASIKVTEVKGNTITFVREKVSNDEVVIESPKLTISGENFIGEDIFLIKNYKYGNLVSTHELRYKVKGVKIAGEPVEKILSK